MSEQNGDFRPAVSDHNEKGANPDKQIRSASSKQLNRRAFLQDVGRYATAVTAGVVVGETKTRATIAALEAADRAGVENPSRNPGARSNFNELDRRIAEDPSRREREETKLALNSTIVGPFNEELLFRGVPSYVASKMEGSEDPYHDVLVGTGGGLSMTRREALIGAASSLTFGMIHNITEKGIDTKNIPLLQIMGGSIYYYLQRKLGIASNIIAHQVSNRKILDMVMKARNK